MTMRLSTRSLAGIERTLVAVGTLRLAVMLTAVRAAAPRRRSTSVPSGGLGGESRAGLGGESRGGWGGGTRAGGGGGGGGVAGLAAAPAAAAGPGGAGDPCGAAGTGGA